MRLLCGIWSLDGRPVLRQEVEQMCVACAPPFRSSHVRFWLEDGIGLAVLESDIAPANRGSEASSELCESPDGTVVAADLWLENRDDLLGRLGSPSGTSNEDLVAAVLRQGTGANAGDFLGEFALAAWQPAERRLLLVRDAMGVRPLFFSFNPGRHLVFASVPNAIFASGRVSRALDDMQLGRAVLREYEPGATLFQNVESVLPGHVVAVTPGSAHQHCYWHPESKNCLNLSQADAAAQLREMVRQATTRPLGTEGAAATHLSGGLDSSSLTVLAARALRGQGRTLSAYSFLPEPWPGRVSEDETAYVAAVLRQEPDIRWTPIRKALPEDWLHDNWHRDGPLSLSAENPENAVLSDAAAQGASVILSGWGGDEGITFNGRGALAAAFRRLQWGYMVRQLRAIQAQRGFPLHKTFVGEVLRPLLTAPLEDRLRRLAGRRALSRPLEPELLSAELRERLLASEPFAVGSDPTLNQLNLLRSGHLAHRTTNFALMGARYGLAFSFPLLNRRIVEFALSLPPTWHIQNGWKRWLYRQAMEGVLPASLQWRHTKLMALPSIAYEFAIKRELLLQRLDQLATNPTVTSLFDLQRFRSVLRNLPDLNAVSNPAADPALALVPSLAHALQYVFYVEQHF